jgi:hypothetical protein
MALIISIIPAKKHPLAMVPPVVAPVLRLTGPALSRRRREVFFLAFLEKARKKQMKGPP